MKEFLVVTVKEHGEKRMRCISVDSIISVIELDGGKRAFIQTSRGFFGKSVYGVTVEDGFYSIISKLNKI